MPPNSSQTVPQTRDRIFRNQHTETILIQTTIAAIPVSEVWLCPVAVTCLEYLDRLAIAVLKPMNPVVIAQLGDVLSPGSLEPAQLKTESQALSSKVCLPVRASYSENEITAISQKQYRIDSESISQGLWI